MATNPPPSNLPIAKDSESTPQLPSPASLPARPAGGPVRPTGGPVSQPPKPTAPVVVPAPTIPKPPLIAAPSPSTTIPPIKSSPTAPPLVPPRPVQPNPAATSNISAKSSIRTMESDIKSIGQGAPAKGVEVTIPSSPPLPSTGQPSDRLPPKPLPPSASISIAGAEKRSVLPNIRPLSPQQVKDKPVPTSAIAVPPKKTAVFNRWTLIAIVVLVVVAGGGYWFYFLREDITPVVTSSPTPTSTPDFLKPLKLIFASSDSVVVPDLASLDDMEPLNLVLSQVVLGESSKNLFLTPENETGEPVTFSSFVSRFLVNQNQSLLDNVTDKRFGLVISRQQEKFDDLGKPITDAEPETRTALIVEITDAVVARIAMSEWEQTLSDDLAELFQITEASEQDIFENNKYRDVDIRFMNFPYPDRSIDYALVSSANNNTYLVIASSREQVYSIVDTLLGF